jgi:peptidoglycan-N-acetylglucosamine deacetylase
MLVCRRDDLREPLLALTFDDGPSPATAPILDTLALHGGRATFFVNGWAVERLPDVLRRAVSEGHEIGNHTYDHIDVQSEQADDAVREQLARTTALVEEVAGTRPRLVRPPYGKDACRTARLAAEQGLSPCILWSTMVWDWLPETDAAWMVERVLTEAQPGSIVVMHDGMPPHVATSREASVAAVAELVPLLARSFRLVTVSELLR